jgi:cysteine-rich repeat protein
MNWKLSFLLVGLGGCTLFLPLINAETCDETFTPQCDGSLLLTCEGGFVTPTECGDLSCNAASLSCDGCGDNVLNTGEQCDDGNTTSGDGCEADCTLPPPPGCGDGTVESPEECDDGNQDNGDGCRSNCTEERCGDSILDPTEACDDGNNTDGDGCDSSCNTEACNGVGHDEDSDGVDDACDNCPTIPNPDQANALEIEAGNTIDAVGDACDPRPSDAGDSIAFFDGFTGNTLSNQWSANSGVWTVSNDELNHADPLPFDLLNRVGFSSSRAVVEMHVIVDSFGSATANLGIGVSMTNATNGVVCTTGVFNGAPVLRLAPLVNGAGGAPRQQQDIADPVGRPIIVFALIDANTICAVAGEAPAFDTITPPTGGVAIRAAGAAIRVQSIITYTH